MSGFLVIAVGVDQDYGIWNKAFLVEEHSDIVIEACSTIAQKELERKGISNIDTFTYSIDNLNKYFNAERGEDVLLRAKSIQDEELKQKEVKKELEERALLAKLIKKYLSKESSLIGKLNEDKWLR